MDGGTWHGGDWYSPIHLTVPGHVHVKDEKPNQRRRFQFIPTKAFPFLIAPVRDVFPPNSLGTQQFPRSCIYAVAMLELYVSLKSQIERLSS